MWHQWFNRKFTKLREYFSCTKKTKITTLFNNSSPLAPFRRVSTEHKQRLLYCVSSSTRIRCFHSDHSVNNVSAFFCFLCAQKIFSYLHKLRMNHWCHMDYFNDLLATFLDLDRGRILAVYAGSENTQNSSKIMNLCSEDEGLTGLERHEGE